MVLLAAILFFCFGHPGWGVIFLLVALCESDEYPQVGNGLPGSFGQQQHHL